MHEHTVVIMLVDVHLLLRQPRYAISLSLCLIVYTVFYLVYLPLLYCCCLSEDYSGHYIVLMDYSAFSDEFVCLNPAHYGGVALLLLISVPLIALTLYYFYLQEPCAFRAASLSRRAHMLGQTRTCLSATGPRCSNI